MSNPKFTPGKWEWRQEEIDGFMQDTRLVRLNGQTVLFAGKLLDRSTGDYISTIDINDHDKALIAAAPTMYEALETIIELFYGYHVELKKLKDSVNDNFLKEALRVLEDGLSDVEDVLKKARGEE